MPQVSVNQHSPCTGNWRIVTGPDDTTEVEVVELVVLEVVEDEVAAVDDEVVCAPDGRHSTSPGYNQVAVVALFARSSAFIDTLNLPAILLQLSLRATVYVPPEQATVFSRGVDGTASALPDTATGTATSRVEETSS